MPRNAAGSWRETKAEARWQERGRLAGVVKENVKGREVKGAASLMVSTFLPRA